MNKRLQQLAQLIFKDNSMTSTQKKEGMQSLKVVEKELDAALLKSNGNSAKSTTDSLLKKALIDLQPERRKVVVKNRELSPLSQRVEAPDWG